jgi:hypothetical protein
MMIMATFHLANLAGFFAGVNLFPCVAPKKKGVLKQNIAG